jgi:sterol desaturase/sphingolipid hydroxylase (fatty acid hydroxylase superfamily)
LVAVNTFAVRLVLPVTAVALADIASERGWGALNLLEWPAPIEFVLGFLLLDFVIYLQHVMFHAVPLFWRLHRVHHADLDFDVTTGVRFHTLEIILSMIIKLGTVLALGPSAWCVVAFEVVLNATSMFNHANIRIPTRLDSVLRTLVVTPDMHRVHHSVIRRETDSNFGFNFPWWDRLCGTYRPQPRDGHLQMDIGLPQYRDERQTSLLHRILMLPFGRVEVGGIVGESEDVERPS